MRVAVCLILFACLLVYGRTLTGTFLSWDDIQHFKFNTWLQAGDIAHFWKEEYYGLYIPVTYTVWTLVYKLSQSPMAFHLLNLILHCANCLLVFAIVDHIIPSPRHKWAALLAALAFALHPVQVEPVAWISGGRDLLSAFFGLSAMFAILKGAPVLATISFALGLLAKPSLAPLPLALLILRPQALSKIVAGVWFSLSAIALWITLQIQSPFAQARVEPIAFWQRPIIALDTLGFYIHQIVNPWPLSSDYGRAPATVIAQHIYIGSIGVLLFAIALGYYLRKNMDPLTPRALAFAVILLIPVLGIVPFEAQVQSTVFDRYLYLPMFGVALACMLLARTYNLRHQWCIAILILWAGLSFARTDVWLTNRKLFTNILENNPRNYFAQTNFALEEIADQNLDSAERHLKIARDLNPRLALAPANLAHVYWLKRTPGSILQEFQPLLENPVFLHYNQHEPQALALLYRMVARGLSTIQHRAEARWSYRQARTLNPLDQELQTEVELYEKEGANLTK